MRLQPSIAYARPFRKRVYASPMVYADVRKKWCSSCFFYLFLQLIHELMQLSVRSLVRHQRVLVLPENDFKWRPG